jgi:hypothetical protein
VSVVIPAYNRADLIERAVASALAQQPRPPAEVIVVDDASADATAQRAAAAGARVVRHERNLGEAGARNTGIEHASHEWVALLDSDDEWLPGHLDCLWALRDGHVLVADSMLVCGDDPSQDRFHGPVSDSPVVVRSPAELVFPQNFINPSATMFRREVGLRAGGYVPGYGTDLHFLLRLLEHGTAQVSPDIGGLYHVHGGQMTQDIRRFADDLRGMVATYAGRPWWSQRQLERLRVVHGWDDLRRSLQRRERVRAARLAAWLVARPSRPAALLGTWAWRLRGRRRSGLVARDGRPTVAVLPGGAAAARERSLREAAAMGTVVDLAAEGGITGAARRLLRRPTSFAVAASPAERILLRLLGIRHAAGTGARP